MNIGFFADDSSACHAALLANSALNREGTPGPGVLAGGHNIADAVPAYLDEADGSHSHLMLALPLALLGDISIRSRLDLAVVSFGPEPLAHDGARRAMASKAARATDALPPPWMLASCNRALPEAPAPCPSGSGRCGVRMPPAFGPAVPAEPCTGEQWASPPRFVSRRTTPTPPGSTVRAWSRP